MLGAVFSVRSRDGLRLAVEQAGAAGGPAVVFVHGFAQSRRVWRSVMQGPLASECRLVAFDLRGHGDSDAPPPDRAAGKWLGADLAAVAHSVGPAPIVVAWSYGAAAVGEYLRAGGRPGGVLLVGAAVQIGWSARELLGPTMLDHARGLASDDAGLYEAAARSFLRGCTARPLARDAFERMATEMLRVPAAVRAALLRRDDDYRADLARCRAPMATLHGRLDSVVLPAMSDRIATLAPGERLERVGHVPWLEDAPAFEAAVRAIATRARAARDTVCVEPAGAEQGGLAPQSE